MNFQVSVWKHGKILSCSVFNINLSLQKVRLEKPVQWVSVAFSSVFELSFLMTAHGTMLSVHLKTELISSKIMEKAKILNTWCSLYIYEIESWVEERDMH